MEEVTKLFQSLMNDIYSVTIDNNTINYISSLAIIFKEYLKINNMNYQNLITIIVGGAPADVLHAYYHNQKINIKDVDIATNMLPNDIEKSITWFFQLSESDKQKMGLKYISFHLLEKINLNSKVNGTINIYIDNDSIPESMRKLEITTFRKESGQRGKHEIIPVGMEKNYLDAIIIDIERRDLTIGTVFCSINTNEISNFKCKFFDELIENPIIQNVLNDTKNGIVRFMGNPYERIYEDGIRILRFIRKSGKTGYKPYLPNFDICLQMLQGLHEPFNININDETYQLKPVSKERILHINDGELIKMFKLNDCVKLFQFIYERSKKMELENLHYLYLPKKPNFSYIKNTIWFDNNNPYVRIISLYINTDFENEESYYQNMDMGLKMLKDVDFSVFGDNQVVMMFSLAILNTSLFNPDFNSEHFPYLFAGNIDKYISKLQKHMNYDKMNKVLNNLIKYIDYLPILFSWSDLETTNFIEKFMRVVTDIKELRKSVFLNPNIQKKHKKITFENIKEKYINNIITNIEISL
jgi:tRNA nucleotidyltransferase/poly(A) polymerase